jgi:hypothetical protein
MKIFFTAQVELPNAKDLKISVHGAIVPSLQEFVGQGEYLRFDFCAMGDVAR